MPPRTPSSPLALVALAVAAALVAPSLAPRPRGAGRAAAAPPPPPAGSQAAREFVVEGNRGAYDVVVSPTYVTVFYLPGPVTKALASDKVNFDIRPMGDTVAVRPLKNTEGLTANLNIDTADMHISIILHVGSQAEAVSQVVFTRAEDRAAIDRRVNEEIERRIGPLRAEWERKHRALDAEIRERAEREVAGRLLARFATRTLDGIERTDDNVIVRVTRALVLGDEVYVSFRIQNRDRAAFVVRGVAVVAGREPVAGRAMLEPRAAGDGPDLGAVKAGDEVAGVVVVPYARLAGGVKFGLRVEGKEGALVVGGLRL